MEIHFQTTDHVVAVEKVAEQHIGTKYSKCNSLRVISHIIILGKSAITHSKVGQSSPNQKNIEERQSVTVVVSEKTVSPTQAHTHVRTHGANYNLPPASRAGDKNTFLRSRYRSRYVCIFNSNENSHHISSKHKTNLS